MVSIVIMAGGLGKRMNSPLPKVLHKVGNLPMIVHVIKTSLELNVNNIFIIIGKFKDIIQEEVSKYFSFEELNKISYIIQEEACGTGHAIQCAYSSLKNINENILILSGDTPLITKNSLMNMINSNNSNSKCILMVKETENPFGLGRVILENNSFSKIIEEKDADETQKKIKLINCGIYMIHSKLICNYIFDLQNNNNQKEFYLTDLIGIIKKNYYDVDLFQLQLDRDIELTGVNNVEELEKLNNLYNLLHSF